MPVLDRLMAYLREQKDGALPKSKYAQAIAYVLNRPEEITGRPVVGAGGPGVRCYPMSGSRRTRITSFSTVAMRQRRPRNATSPSSAASREGPRSSA